MAAAVNPSSPTTIQVRSTKVPEMKADERWVRDLKKTAMKQKDLRKGFNARYDAFLEAKANVERWLFFLSELTETFRRFN